MHVVVIEEWFSVISLITKHIALIFYNRMFAYMYVVKMACDDVCLQYLFTLKKVDNFVILNNETIRHLCKYYTTVTLLQKGRYLTVQCSSLSAGSFCTKSQTLFHLQAYMYFAFLNTEENSDLFCPLIQTLIFSGKQNNHDI